MHISQRKKIIYQEKKGNIFGVWFIFTQMINKYLFSIHQVPSTVPGAMATLVGKVLYPGKLNDLFCVCLSKCVLEEY